MSENPERLVPQEDAHYSPGEYAEAFAKADQREKGVQEAKFYREFLDKLREAVKFQARRVDLNKAWGDEDVKTRWAKHKIGEFEILGRQGYLDDEIKKAIGAANKLAGTEIPSVRVVIAKISEMTPNEFFAYTRQLEATLIGAEPPKKKMSPKKSA